MKIDIDFLDKLEDGKVIRFDHKFLDNVFVFIDIVDSKWIINKDERNILEPNDFLVDIFMLYLYEHIIANKDLDLFGELPSISFAEEEQKKILARLYSDIILYSFVASFGELRHCKGLSSTFFKKAFKGFRYNSRLFYWKSAFDIYNNINKEQLQQMFVYYYYIFNLEGVWDKSFGGYKWGIPSMLYLKHSLGVLNDKQYVDLVLSHEHNTGNFFNKCFSGNNIVKSVLIYLFDERISLAMSYIKNNISISEEVIKWVDIIEYLIKKRRLGIDNKSKCAEFRNDVMFQASVV